MSNWWDDYPDAPSPLSAQAGRAAAEATDPRFAPQAAPTAADDNWWKMAPDANRSVMDQIGRYATLLPQGINKGLYGAASFLPDMSGWAAQKTGLAQPGPLPSQINTGAGQKAFGYDYNPNVSPENTAEKAVLDTGDALGSVAATAVPGGIAANSIRTGLGAPALSYGQTVAKNLATQPGMQVAGTVAGNVTGDLTGNPYAGLAASFAPATLAHGAMRVPFSAPAENGSEASRRALLATAKDEGVLPSFGTIQNSYPAKMFESVVSKLPFMGNAQAKLNENNKTAFDTAAIGKLPEMHGEGVDAFTSGNRDMIGNRIGKKFDALENGTTINIDPQVGTDLAKAKADFSKQLESQMPQSITSELDELANASAQRGTVKVDAGGNAMNPVDNVSIDGETYKNIRSKLSAMLGSTSGTDRQAVGAMINALDGAVERSLPKDMVQDWKDARQSWQRFQMLKGATDARHNSQTDAGHIPPGSLAARVGNDKEMERLAQVGTSFVGDKMPDSGTSMRLGIQNALGLGGTAAGAFTFPMTTAALAGGGIAANAMMNNPYTRAALINRLQRSREGILNKGLVATLAGQQALGQPR